MYGTRGSASFDSRYRPTRTSLSRRDYAPSIGGYDSQVDWRDESYSSRGMGSVRNSPPRFRSDASVSTNMLNGMIDSAIGSPRDYSSSSYRSVSAPRRTLASDYTVDSYSRMNHGSGTHNYRRDISEPRGSINIPQMSFHTRDTSPMYRDSFDNRIQSSGSQFGSVGVRDSRRISDGFHSNVVREYSPRTSYQSPDRRYERGDDADTYYDRMRSPSSSPTRTSRDYNAGGNYDDARGYGPRGRDYPRDNYHDDRSFAPIRDREYERENYEGDRSFAAPRGGEYNRYGDDRSYAPVHGREEGYVRERLENQITFESPPRERAGLPPVFPMSSQVPHPVQDVPRTSAQSEFTGYNGADNRSFQQNSLNQSLVMQSMRQSLSTIQSVTNNNPPIQTATRVGNPPTDSGQSLVSAVTIGSAWHTKDIVLLPKGQNALGAALAATATASLIVDDKQTVCSFETALKALSEIVEPTVKNGNISNVIQSSVMGKPQEEHSHIPVSYSAVQESVKRSMMVTSALEAQEPTDTSAKDPHQLWARCTLLVSAAILKADPNRTQLAQTAAETVMTHGIATITDNWLETADDDLKKVANATCEAIQASPEGDDAMADLAVVAILGDGGKYVSMERIRKSFPSKATEDNSNITPETSGGNVISNSVTQPGSTNGESNSRPIDYPPTNVLNGASPTVGAQMSSPAIDYPPRDLSRQLRGSSTTESLTNLDSPSGQSRNLDISRAIKSSASNDGPIVGTPSNEGPSEVRRSRSLLDNTSSSQDEEAENVPSSGIGLNAKFRGVDSANPTLGQRVGGKREELTGKREELARALNRMLAQSDEEKAPKPLLPPQVQPHRPNPALAGKRDEIAQRVQRIQMRAAAKRDETRAIGQINQVPDISGHLGTLGGINGQETKKQRPRRPRSRSKPPPRGISDASLDGSIFSPVVHFLSSMKHCKAFLPEDEEDFLDDNNTGGMPKRIVDDSKNQMDEWTSFKQAEAGNVQNNIEFKSGENDPPKLSMEPGADSTSPLDSPENGAVSSPPPKLSVTPDAPPRPLLPPPPPPPPQVNETPDEASRRETVAPDTSDNATQGWEMLDEVSVAENNIRQSPIPGLRKASSSESGAFSEAFEGKISNISITKLSLTPPTQNMETSQTLFLQQSSALPYQVAQTSSKSQTDKDESMSELYTSNVSAWRAKQAAAGSEKKKGIRGRLPRLRKISDK